MKRAGEWERTTKAGRFEMIVVWVLLIVSAWAFAWVIWQGLNHLASR